MDENYNCSQCEQPFNNGDIVEQTDTDAYHSYHNRRSYVMQPGIRPDCFETFIKSGFAAVSSRGPLVYYEGELYTGAQMNDLAQSGVDLQVEGNSGDNGHTVSGELSGLVRNLD